MPTGLPLDFDVLLAPIPGDDPAGSSSTYLEMRSRLDDLRQQVDPDDFDADDPARPDTPRFADWRKVEEITARCTRQGCQRPSSRGLSRRGSCPRI